MKVNVFDADTQSVHLNIRYTDEIGEDLGLSDTEISRMDDEIKKTGRYWVGPYYLSRWDQS